MHEHVFVACKGGGLLGFVLYTGIELVGLPLSLTYPSLSPQ